MAILKNRRQKSFSPGSAAINDQKTDSFWNLSFLYGRSETGKNDTVDGVSAVKYYIFYKYRTGLLFFVVVKFLRMVYNALS